MYTSYTLILASMLSQFIAYVAQGVQLIQAYKETWIYEASIKGILFSDSVEPRASVGVGDLSAAVYVLWSHACVKGNVYRGQKVLALLQALRQCDGNPRGLTPSQKENTYETSHFNPDCYDCGRRDCRGSGIGERGRWRYSSAVLQPGQKPAVRE